MHGPPADILVPRIVLREHLEGGEDRVGLGRVEEHGLGELRDPRRAGLLLRRPSEEAFDERERLLRSRGHRGRRNGAVADALHREGIGHAFRERRGRERHGPEVQAARGRLDLHAVVDGVIRRELRGGGIHGPVEHHDHLGGLGPRAHGDEGRRRGVLRLEKKEDGQNPHVPLHPVTPNGYFCVFRSVDATSVSGRVARRRKRIAKQVSQIA